jgi:superfamily II DNA or RNA helicase
MPTGTGKTEVALHIMHRLPVSTLVVSPVRDLMYQWHQRIQERLGYDAGIIGDNTFNKRPVSVTTYDSACIHMQDFGAEFELLIFDECHHLPGQIRADAARMSVAPYRLGLTATPERSDGRDAALGSLIGPIVFRYPLSEARGHTLADYEVKRIPVYLKPEERAEYDRCSGVIRHFMMARRKEDPNYSFIELRKEHAKSPEARQVLQAFYKKESIEDRADEKMRVLEDLFRLHPGQRILVFTKTNIMAREVSARFLIPSLLHHCRKKERKDILDGFRNNRYAAIVANQVLDEGVDLPEAKVAVVLGGLASVKQAKQRLGRILRKRGEETAILYEVVCSDTKEVKRSQQRRRSDAYEGTRHLRI